MTEGKNILTIPVPLASYFITKNNLADKFYTAY